MIKRLAKSVLRVSANLVGPHRWRHGPCLLVLTYHRVLPEGHPDRASEQPGMLVTPELLAMHFETLKHYFMPVYLDDWLRAARAGDPPPGRSLAITFDDGWRDNYEYAFPVIEAAGMPATIFLVSDMVGSSYRFWPNRLANALKAWNPGYGHRLDEATRRRMAELGIPLDLNGVNGTPELISSVIARCKMTADDASMHVLLDKVEEVLPSPDSDSVRDDGRDLLDWDEVGRLAGSGLVRFGSHTRRHTRLREDIPSEMLEDEVAGSRLILEQRLGAPVPLFCYPSGYCSAAGYEAVSRVYEGAVGTRHGWNEPGFDPFRVRRIGIHGDVSATATSLLARTTGWPRL